MSATLSVIAPLDLLLPSVIDPCGAGRVERAAAGSIPNSRVTDEMKSERKRERERVVSFHQLGHQEETREYPSCGPVAKEME